MGKPPFAHQMISFDCCFDIMFMDSDGDPHEYMLRPLHDFSHSSSEDRIVLMF